MKEIVFGRTGQVARELARRLPDARFVGREDADLTDPNACAALIRNEKPAVVINAAAYTAVDRAESEPDLAHRINAEAPGAMADACAVLGISLLHISTDYVFDGSGHRPWRESDPAAPLGVYGATKLDGERRIAAAGGDHVILRTSWVFSAHGGNFVKTMLRLGREKPALRIVDDQRGGPTPAADIAAALSRIATELVAGRGETGIFHFAGAPTVSWADFATEIFARAGLEVQVERIASAEYPTPARRPLNSALDCTRIADAYGIVQPDWRIGLEAVLKELERRG
jgi:dTDP-4-dehydrorhamnose reductase